MPKIKPRVGISLRITEAQNYQETRDSLSQEWVPLLEKLSFQPVLIPNNLSNIPDFITEMDIDSIILSGGDDIGKHPIRDKTEKQIIEFAIKSRIPIFGVCRGMQILNNYFNGSLTHTSTNHDGQRHLLDLVNKKFVEHLEMNSIDVNSFHNNIINEKDLGSNLNAFAIFKDDNTIEAFFHNDLPIVGVMWHPERDSNPVNDVLLKKTLIDKAFWRN